MADVGACCERGPVFEAEGSGPADTPAPDGRCSLDRVRCDVACDLGVLGREVEPEQDRLFELGPIADLGLGALAGPGSAFGLARRGGGLGSGVCGGDGIGGGEKSEQSTMRPSALRLVQRPVSARCLGASGHERVARREELPPVGRGEIAQFGMPQARLGVVHLELLAGGVNVIDHAPHFRARTS